MTTPKSSSDARRSLDYAEKTLGVHAVYEHACELRTKLDDGLAALAELRDAKRDREVEIHGREMDLTLEEAERHPEMSVAAMDRHLKKVIHKDPRLAELRAALTAGVSMIEGVEYDIRVIETDIKIATARLNELGGYLQYLAAIKLNNKANKTSEAGEA